MNNSRAALTRALENYKRYDLGTYGSRDAIHRDIPNAIEAMIDEKIAAAMQAREVSVTARDYHKGLR